MAGVHTSSPLILPVRSVHRWDRDGTSVPIPNHNYASVKMCTPHAAIHTHSRVCDYELSIGLIRGLSSCSLKTLVTIPYHHQNVVSNRLIVEMARAEIMQRIKLGIQIICYGQQLSSATYFQNFAWWCQLYFYFGCLGD